ncbi:uncharacterized protein LOC129789738 [Lutzomyia longipalpis]|nr:uncharacterized protein LOC129789738 [Lutzomyia longipalpis]XP_055682742.1 uncharacterized protein LOC129789738 [Lutzomyia longipalpis]
MKWLKKWEAALIKEVQRYPQIWDDSHPEYLNRFGRRTLFTDIQHILYTEHKCLASVDKIMVKWRNMRTYFLFLCMRLEKEKKEGAVVPVNWDYFEAMSFIKPSILEINEINKSSLQQNWRRNIQKALNYNENEAAKPAGPVEPLNNKTVGVPVKSPAAVVGMKRQRNSSEDPLEILSAVKTEEDERDPLLLSPSTSILSDDDADSHDFPLASSAGKGHSTPSMSMDNKSEEPADKKSKNEKDLLFDTLTSILNKREKDCVSNYADYMASRMHRWNWEKQRKAMRMINEVLDIIDNEE